MSDSLTELVGETDASKWAQSWARTIVQHPEIPHDEGTMITWFANAIMTGYDEGVAVERRRTMDERLTELAFLAAGAGTGVAMRQNPLWVFDSQAVSDAVKIVLKEHGITPPEGY